MGFHAPPSILYLIILGAALIVSIVTLGLSGSQESSARSFNSVCGAVAGGCSQPRWYPAVALGITAGVLGMVGCLTAVFWQISSFLDVVPMKLIMLIWLALVAVFALVTGILAAIAAGNASGFCFFICPAGTLGALAFFGFVLTGVIVLAFLLTFRAQSGGSSDDGGNDDGDDQGDYRAARD